jgi:hypothetical protein
MATAYDRSNGTAWPLVAAKRRLVRLWQYARYGSPNLAMPRVALSPRAESWLESLRREGIVRIEDEAFRAAADYIEDAYFAPLERSGSASSVRFNNPDLFLLDGNQPKYIAGGIEISVYVSFKDPALSALFFHPELNALLYNYYGRQPYYRNLPMLQKVSYETTQAPFSNGQFHVDHPGQVSLMLLVSTVTERDTHMEYAAGSHRHYRLEGPHPDAVARCGYRLVPLTGEKGTLFVFDASGVHRACYLPGVSRKILHLNVTTGHHIQTAHRRDDLDRWPALEQLPAHSRRMMAKVGRRRAAASNGTGG